MDSLSTFIEKWPNWLRYILAIPFGILAYIVISFIILLGQSLFNDTNSIWITLISFIISNGISIIIFLNSVYFMIPNNKYKFTLVLAIFIEIFYTILTFNIFTIANITLEIILAYILFTICLVFTLYFLHNNPSSKKIYNTTTYEEFDDKNDEVLDNEEIKRIQLNEILNNPKTISNIINGEEYIVPELLLDKINPYNNKKIEEYDDIIDYLKSYLEELQEINKIE